MERTNTRIFSNLTPTTLLLLLSVLISLERPILVEGAMHWSLLRILSDDQLEQTDRAKLVGNYKSPTFPTNDYLVDHTCLQQQQEDDSDEQTCQADPANRRSVFPKDDQSEEPLVCLAFLSCCGRTDLLQSTMQAVIHHMEHDEPDVLKRRYEIAWLDNGSPHEKQEHISSTFQVDHALPMPRNMGLAWGMNALIFDMCTAPYILLLEEDWLYMDGAVADHNIHRRHAIANALALLESNPVDPDTQRPIKGVFLRTESNIVKTGRGVVPHATLGDNDEYTRDQLEYRISCMKFPENGHIFGAFTNGAGLYDRQALVQQVGRMYGEPGDVFSDLAVEGNYSFRVGLKFCAARLQMDPSIPECDFDDNPSVPPTCAAVFAHIGGGRGTRPARRIHMKCPDDAWNFYGTPWFDQIPKQECSKKLGTIWEQLLLNEQFQRINDENNEEVFRKEKEQRKNMLQLADLFEPKANNPDEFRKYYGAHDPQYATMSDDEIRNFPTKLRNMARSEHQLPGFWDILGRPLGVEFEVPGTGTDV